MLAVKTQVKRLEDRNYLVVGLGTTGASVAHFLLEGGYRCRVQDTRDLPPGLAQLREERGEFEFHAGPLPADWIRWADVLVISPGLPVRDPVIQDAIAGGKQVVPESGGFEPAEFHTKHQRKWAPVDVALVGLVQRAPE